MRIWFKTIVLLLALAIRSHADETGTCKSLDPYYKNITFNLEQTTDIEYALNFIDEHPGQMVTEKDEELYSIIWIKDFPAPATQYICNHMEVK